MPMIIHEINEIDYEYIAEIIRNLQDQGLDDETISNTIEQEFGPLRYGDCAAIDSLLYSNYGGYFRAAYDFPTMGSIVDVPAEDGLIPVVVNEVYFFTFSI